MPRQPNCAAIIVADAANRAAAVNAAAAAIAKDGAALLRVGNPLSAPLTLRRLLIQVDPAEAWKDSEEDEEAQLCQLLERRAAVGPVVLVIEQAETLEPAALLPLQRLASNTGSIKLLFFGKPTFWSLLEGAGLTPLRRALNAPETKRLAVMPEPEAVFPAFPIEPQPPASAWPVVPEEPPAAVTPMTERWIAAPRRSRRRWWIGGLVGLFVTFLAAAVLAPGGLFYRATPQQAIWTQVVTPAQPSPRQDRPLAVQPPPSVPEGRTRSRQAPAPSLPDDASPAAGPNKDALAEAQRGTRFDPPRAAPPQGAPFGISQSGGRVVIHYREQLATSEAISRLMAEAAPLAARVQTRVVADTPSAAEIRFFHPEDGSRARQLANALHGGASNWQVRDFSFYHPSPSAGTVEVWVPR